MLLTIHSDVEIRDEDILDIIKKEVHEAIVKQVQSKTRMWGAEEAMRRKVTDLYDKHLDDMIRTELANSAVLREKVVKEIEAKLRRQVSAIMKKADYTGDAS